MHPILDFIRRCGFLSQKSGPGIVLDRWLCLCRCWNKSVLFQRHLRYTCDATLAAASYGELNVRSPEVSVSKQSSRWNWPIWFVRNMKDGIQNIDFCLEKVYLHLHLTTSGSRYGTFFHLAAHSGVSNKDLVIFICCHNIISHLHVHVWL